VKQSVVIHLTTGARTLTIKHSVFSVMAGLIVEMLFILFSVYDVV